MPSNSSSKDAFLSPQLKHIINIENWKFPKIQIFEYSHAYFLWPAFKMLWIVVSKKFTFNIDKKYKT